MKVNYEDFRKKICQSCGMLINKASQFGTYDDGSLHNKYCHFCFKQGKFTDSGTSMEEKIAKNIAMAVKMGIPGEKAATMAHETIPKLKRWRQ
jgi:hypothetical protein